MLALLAHTYAVAGQRGEARKKLEVLQERARTKPMSSSLMALVHMGLGEKDLALEWLEKAYEQRSQWLAFLKIWPLFDGVRSDPRFKALLKKIGLEL